MAASTLAELERMIKDNIDDALMDDVATEVQNTLARYARDVVYHAYSPVEYIRRYGLAIPSMYQPTLKGRNVLFVESVDPSNYSIVHGRSTPAPALSHWIEYGEVPNIFDKSKDYPFTEKRPFVSMATQELQSGRAVDALKNGMRKRGFQVV